MLVTYEARVSMMVTVEFMSGRKLTYTDITNFNYEDGDLVLYRSEVGAVHIPMLSVKWVGGTVLAIQVPQHGEDYDEIGG